MKPDWSQLGEVTRSVWVEMVMEKLAREEVDANGLQVDVGPRTLGAQDSAAGAGLQGSQQGLFRSATAAFPGP